MNPFVAAPFVAAPFVATLLSCVGLAGILWRAGRLRQTTLRAVWWWALVAFCAVFATELLVGLLGSRIPLGGRITDAVEPIRYGAAMLTFCPMMALLGAKRPQSRAWQFIVLSLWLILLIPAIQWWLFRPSPTMHVFAAWQLFLVLQLAIGLVNYLPTRYALAALLATVGQVLLISKHLPLVGFSLPNIGDVEVGPLLALAALASAAWMVHLADRRHRPPPPGIDRLWFDFRDLFGVVWAVRVGQQINAYSAMYGWHIALRWNGLLPPTEGPMSEQTAAALRKSLRSILRRFVPPEWIAERLQAEEPAAPRTNTL